MKPTQLFLFTCLLLLNACYQAEVPDLNSCRVTRMDNLRFADINKVEAYDFKYDQKGRIKELLFFQKDETSLANAQKFKFVTIYDETSGKPVRLDGYQNKETKVLYYYNLETNEKGQVTKASYFFGQPPSGTPQAINTYTYDEAGNLSLAQYADLRTVIATNRYVYDDFGNLTEYYEKSGNSTEKLVEKYTAYDNKFNVLQIQNSTLVVAFFQTNLYLSKNNVLKSEVYSSTGSLLEQVVHSYQYNRQGFPFVLKETYLTPAGNLKFAFDYTAQYQCP
ncbi:MAG: hypothetical protein H7Y04_08520 [Verrucomicrobia bacterium]|nr:hypothetical protein [Cytophagales bacterium]